MDIKNVTSALNAYRYASDNIGGAGRTQKKDSARTNKDKAEFSSASRASFADTLKAAAAKSADTAASPERLNAISQSIKNGSYSVSAEELASSIMGF